MQSDVEAAVKQLTELKAILADRVKVRKLQHAVHCICVHDRCCWLQQRATTTVASRF